MEYTQTDLHPRLIKLYGTKFELDLFGADSFSDTTKQKCLNKAKNAVKHSAKKLWNC